MPMEDEVMGTHKTRDMQEYFPKVVGDFSEWKKCLSLFSILLFAFWFCMFLNIW